MNLVSDVNPVTDSPGTASMSSANKRSCCWYLVLVVAMGIPSDGWIITEGHSVFQVVVSSISCSETVLHVRCGHDWQSAVLEDQGVGHGTDRSKRVSLHGPPAETGGNGECPRLGFPVAERVSSATRTATAETDDIS